MGSILNATTDPRPTPVPAAAGNALAGGEPHAQPPEGLAAAVAVAHRIPIQHYLWIAGFAIVVAAALHWLGRVLTPFLIGAILAFLGTPVVDELQRRHVPRWLGTLVVILIFGLLIGALFFVLVPLVQAEIALVARRLPDIVSKFLGSAAPWIEERFGMRIALDVETLRGMVQNNAQGMRDLGIRLLSGVRAGGLLVLALLVDLVLIPVVMFYVLRDWNMLIARVDELIPHRWRASVRTMATEIHDVLSEFLHGQVLVMVVLATYYAIGLYFAGLPRPFAIGILTGLLVFIPYVGYGLGLTLALTAALLEWNGWPGFLAVAGVYAVGQLLENYVLIPWLVGDRIGLHPLAVIFALMAFGALFGFAGVLLALPLAAALLVGLRHLRALYDESQLFQEE